MFRVPVSFVFSFDQTNEVMRRYIMHEFAENGAEHLVFGDSLMSAVLGNPDLADKLQKEIQDEGMSFADAHAIFGTGRDLCSPDEDGRRRRLLTWKTELNIAADMGVSTLTIHTGNENRYPGIPLETLRQNIIRALDELLPEAEKCGVTICIENIWHRINTPESLWLIKKEFPTPYLGFCFDAGHANLMDKGRSLDECPPRDVWKYSGMEPVWDDKILEKMLSEIVNCHLHDNDGSGDRHQNIGIGNVDWKHVVGLLKQAPRLKCIQCEVSPVWNKVSVKSLCEKFRELSAL